ncbi:MAG: hypothetical protein V3U57_03640 [Robiginitomaculum sp.]
MAETMEGVKKTRGNVRFTSPLSIFSDAAMSFIDWCVPDGRA